METLSIEDIRNLNEGIQQLYSLHTLDTFGTNALSIVDRLVPGDVPGAHTTNLRTGEILMTLLSDFSSFIPEMTRIMTEYFWEHPICKKMPQTLEGVYKISDFISLQELYTLEGLYQQFLRLLDTEDQIVFFLPNPHPVSWQKLLQGDTTIVGFSTQRAWGKFTERDRLILNLLRPHLFQAYSNARHYQQLHQSLDRLRRSVDRVSSDLHDRIGSIVVNNHGQIQSLEEPNSIDRISSPSQSIILLETYFVKSTSIGQLPDNLWAWVKHQISDIIENPDRSKGCLPLRIQQAGKELTIRLVIEQLGKRYLLLLEEQTLSLVNALARLGLTPRETDVLALVMQGKDNKSIATEMNIGTSTVRKHLEHIYGKLGVQSRMEASAKSLTALGFRL